MCDFVLRNKTTRQEVYEMLMSLPIEEQRSDILLQKMQTRYSDREIIKQAISNCIIWLKRENRINYKIVRKKGDQSQYSIIHVL